MQPDQNDRETGARKYTSSPGPEPQDEFSQDAAGNKPPKGIGNAEPHENGKPGTTEQSPRWEGPKANRPRGYLPAMDDPDEDTDAAGENNRNPEKSDLGDVLKQKDDEPPAEDDDKR
jgi:hypothetical protein